jgi:hypothetical protein
MHTMGLGHNLQEHSYSSVILHNIIIENEDEIHLEVKISILARPHN